MNNLTVKLSKIQQELKAPKDLFNKFGGYNYRSCESILEAVKPLLNDCVVQLNDEIVIIGDRYYIKATAKITDGETSIENSAYAREAAEKKGMDEAQITGSASSYARKYALNGLFLIDDTKDSDAINTHGKEEDKQPAKPPYQKPQEKKDSPEMATTAQIQKIQILMKEAGIVAREGVLAELSKSIGREITSSKNLSKAEAAQFIDKWGQDADQQ